MLPPFNYSIPRLCSAESASAHVDVKYVRGGITHAPRGFVDGDRGWPRSRLGDALGLQSACSVLASSHTLMRSGSRREDLSGRGTPHMPCTSCHARLAALWTRNAHKFFHFLVEVLPLVAEVLSAEQQGAEPPLQLLLSCRSPFARASLELLGVAAGRTVCRRDKVSYATTHELLWPRPAPCGGAREEALRSLRASLLLRPAETGRRGAALLHERREHRRLTNHAIVLEALRAGLARVGVRVFVGTAPLREQVATFHSARCQIGPHGAGMSLMVFAPNDFGTAEISPGRYFVRLAGRDGLHLNRNRNRSAASVGEPNACYRGLAAGLGQRHEWLLMAGATANSDLTPAVADVVRIARHACSVSVYEEG